MVTCRAWLANRGVDAKIHVSEGVKPMFRKLTGAMMGLLLGMAPLVLAAVEEKDTFVLVVEGMV
jgi:hypothetical protein